MTGRRDLGVLREHRGELALSEHYDVDLRGCDDRRRATEAAHQSDLAEEVTGAENRYAVPVPDHSGRPVHDDEELARKSSLPRHHPARRQRQTVGQPCQVGTAGSWDVAKEWNGRDLVGVHVFPPRGCLRPAVCGRSDRTLRGSPLRALCGLLGMTRSLAVSGFR